MAMNELADRPLRVADEIFLLHWWRTTRWFMNLRAVPRWHERSARFLTRLYRRIFYDGLTRTGKIILLGSLFIFLSSYRETSDFLLVTAAFGVALLLWSAVLGFIWRPRVTVSRNSPPYAVAGQPQQSQVTVTNTGPRALFNFSVREQVIPFGRWPQEWRRPHQAQLAAGHSSSLTVEFTAQKRGVMQLTGLTVQSYFPFFLTRFSQRIDSPCAINVLPAALPANIPSLRHIAELASKRLSQGLDNARKGPSLEYAYSRQYQTGDSLRRMDHRASSRRGSPMSKVFEGSEEIRRDQVYLIINLTLDGFEVWQPRPRNEAALDQRLALAVEIGLSAQNEGFNLTAVAMGRDWHQLDSILAFYQHIAACRPARACTSIGASLPNTVLAENGIHVLVLGRWTDEASALVDRWQRQGILVLVFMLAESIANAGSLPEGSQFIEIATHERKRRPGVFGERLQ
ncbi:MAG: DUF58 domain-containing protein [Pseudohongiellaceae bacterium]